MVEEEFLVRFNRNGPARRSSIERCQAQLNFSLPPDYIHFIQEANGGEGFIGKVYLVLWRIEDLVDMNSAYHVSEFVPGIFLFGSDGGDDAFGYDSRSETTGVISVPFVGMEFRALREVAPNFETFLNSLFRL